jgi:cell division protein FtsW (lipid II flippase)
MEIGFFGGTILCIIMASMVFVGLHINKPFPWEHKVFDKSDIKYRDGDNT